MGLYLSLLWDAGGGELEVGFQAQERNVGSLQLLVESSIMMILLGWHLWKNKTNISFVANIPLNIPLKYNFVAINNL